MPIVLFDRVEIGYRRPRHTTPPLLSIGGLAHALLGNPSEACSVITKGIYKGDLGHVNWNCFHSGGKLIAYTSR
jgi:hypothetical protein